MYIPAHAAAGRRPGRRRRGDTAGCSRARSCSAAADRLSSIAEELTTNFRNINNSSTDTEQRLHRMGANFRQHAEEFAQVASQSTAHVQAFADELQARSHQLSGATSKVDQAGGTLQECSREVTLAVDYAAKLLSEVTSGLQTHSDQLTSVSDQAVERTREVNNAFAEGASKVKNVTEQNSQLLGEATQSVRDQLDESLSQPTPPLTCHRAARREGWHRVLSS